VESLSGIRYGPQITAAALSNGLDPRFLAAVAAQETGGPDSDSGANIVGDSGHGHGLFQLDDRWQAIAGTSSAMDPATNAQYAAKMLAGLLHRYGGNMHAALSAYNAGSPNATGTVTTWSDGSRLGYADSVMRHLNRLQTRDQLLGENSPATTQLSALDQLAAGTTASSASTASSTGTANSSSAGSTSLTSAELSAMPQAPQIPSSTIQSQPFRSYTSEYQDGGGSIADQTAKNQGDSIDPTDNSSGGTDA
jgi:hypothetical protein